MEQVFLSLNNTLPLFPGHAVAIDLHWDLLSEAFSAENPVPQHFSVENPVPRLISVVFTDSGSNISPAEHAPIVIDLTASSFLSSPHPSDPVWGHQTHSEAL